MNKHLSIIVDNRETKIKDNKVFTELFKDIPVKFENLTNGDIQILEDNNVLYVFERKTITDLKASIIDGRYRNQKISILEKYDKTQIFYIFEWNESSVDPIVKGAMINTMMRDNICIFKTTNVEDTIILVYDIFKRVSKQDWDKVKIDKQIISNKDNNTYISMLCQIPGVSTKIANSIQSLFPTMNALVNDLSNKTYQEKLNLFKGLCTIDNKDASKSRKVSSRTINNIIEALS